MRECFIAKEFQQKSLNLIARCNDIIRAYLADGYDLTLRQLYYQLVAADEIPNNMQSYNRLGELTNNARLAGLMDWNAIVDRGRGTISNSHWDSPSDIVRAAANSFEIDKWEDQPNHVEIMVEKQALEGVLIPVCEKLDVGFTANKGYSSQSFMYRRGKYLGHVSRDKDIHIIYLGDHDPSGLDMDRDVKERLGMFANADINFHRIALTRGQIDKYDPPPNPAKITDSRARDYISLHGDNSWELDALEPRVLVKLVKEKVEELRDDDLWDDQVAKEDEMKETLDKWASEYEEN